MKASTDPKERKEATEWALARHLAKLGTQEPLDREALKDPEVVRGMLDRAHARIQAAKEKANQ